MTYTFFVDCMCSIYFYIIWLPVCCLLPSSESFLFPLGNGSSRDPGMELSFTGDWTFFSGNPVALRCRSKLLTTTTFRKAAQICTDGVGQKFCWTSFKNAEAECLQSALTHLKKERKKEINVLFGEAAKACSGRHLLSWSGKGLTCPTAFSGGDCVCVCFVWSHNGSVSGPVFLST